MPERTPKPFALALFWLGIQTVWGALLGISLQARSLQLQPANALIAYSYLAAFGAAVAAVTQIVAGIWSDRRARDGSRRIEFYLTGGLAGCVGVAAFYEAPTFASLTLAYGVLELGINVAIGPYQAIIPDLVDRARTGVASSWMAALQSLGNAIGAILASVVADARMLALAIDVLLAGTCALTCAHVRTLPARSRDDEPLRISRAFVDLFVSRALVYVGFFTLVGYLLFYVRGILGNGDLNEARLRSGVLILIFTVVGAVGAAVAAKPSDRFDRRLVATIGGAVTCIALVVFIASRAMPGAAVATCVAGIGWGVFLVADWALACRIMPAAGAATTMGIWNLAVILPQVFAPVVTGLALQRLSLSASPAAPRIAFMFAIGETLLGIAWLWRLPRCAQRE